jgi:hypothetical protein
MDPRATLMGIDCGPLNGGLLVWRAGPGRRLAWDIRPRFPL